MVAAHQPGGGIAQRLRELFPQLQPGAQQAHFDIGLAQIECVGSLPDRKSFDIAQQKNQPVFLVQPGQRLVQQPAHLVLVNQLFRRLPPVRDEFRVRDGIETFGRFRGLLQRNGVQALALADYF